MKLINEQEIFDTWAPMLEEKTGVTNKEKLMWMSKYTHNHTLEEASGKLNEGFAYPAASTLNTPGMGNVTPAGAAAGGAQAFYSGTTTGSGDKFPSLLPLSIQVAARTNGFDIVPVIPMNGPSGVLTYLDYVYAGGKQPFGAKPGAKGSANPGINSYTDKPLAFQIQLKGEKRDAFKAAAVGTEFLFTSGDSGSEDVVRVAKIGRSRVSGKAIFRLIGEAKNISVADFPIADVAETLESPQTVALADIFNGEDTLMFDTAGDEIYDGSVIDTFPELVKALEDHIQGFSGAGPNDDVDWSGNYVDGTIPYEPMRRGVGEEQYYRTMGLEAFTNFIEAETYQIAGTATTEQLQDLNRQYGVDVHSMIENALINDVSQSINKHILSRAFALGWGNHVEFADVEDVNFNLTLDPNAAGNSTPAYIDKEGINMAMVWPAQQQFGLSGAALSLNQGTVHRQVYSRVLAAANVIAQRGRRGPANFVVTNLQVATILQDNAQFTAFPLSNTINQSNGALYPLGEIAGMTIYVDPNMKYGDNRVLVGRKGSEEEPGLKFMPYLMAEKIQTITEGTASSKLFIKSRYALVEAGHHPQTQYFTFDIAMPAGGLV